MRRAESVRNFGQGGGIMLIKNRSDIHVPLEMHRSCKLYDVGAGDYLAREIIKNFGQDWRFLDLKQKDLQRAMLRGVDLSDASLSKSNLFCANLHCADLTRTDLGGTSLVGADLTRTDLTDANLRCANLFCADMTGAKITGKMLEGSISLATVKHERIIGLGRPDQTYPDWYNIAQGEPPLDSAVFVSECGRMDLLAIGLNAWPIKELEKLNKEDLQTLAHKKQIYRQDDGVVLLKEAKEKAFEFREKGE